METLNFLDNPLVIRYLLLFLGLLLCILLLHLHILEQLGLHLFFLLVGFALFLGLSGWTVSWIRAVSDMHDLLFCREVLHNLAYISLLLLIILVRLVQFGLVNVRQDVVVLEIILGGKLAHSVTVLPFGLGVEILDISQLCFCRFDIVFFFLFGLVELD